MAAVEAMWRPGFMATAAKARSRKRTKRGGQPNTPDSLKKMAAAPYNPRAISDSALAGLRASLLIFGDLSGIVVNRRTGHLVCGHQRKRGLADLKIGKIAWDHPYKTERGAEGDRFASDERDGWAVLPDGARVRVREVDWPLDFEKAANLAANSPLISGTFTAAARPLIESMGLRYPKLSAAILLDGLVSVVPGAQTKDGLTDPDAVPEPPAKPITKPGDLWTLGDHRLLCGDATKAEDVRRVTRQEKTTLVSDPPYGIGYEYISHDDADNEANLALVQAAWALAPDGRVWTCGLNNLARDLAWNPKAKILSWHKGFAAAGNGLGGASTWEPILAVNVKGGSLPNNHLSFSTDRIAGLLSHHSCPKPVALWEHLVRHLARGDIYDPFLGSGTTMIACERLGRRCRALEIEPKYCDVIVKRWEAFTGQKAKRVA